MTPEERIYKILQDSNYIRVPEHETKIESFVESSKDCVWYQCKDDIEKRQFETVLKTWFEQYTAELIEFAEKNPPTFEGREKDLDHINLHTMDDQGFEGQVMCEREYIRNIQSTIDWQKKLKCDFIDNDKAVLTCVEQAKMYQLGYVMDYNHDWFKPTKEDEIGDKIMSASVDWVHLHNGPNCEKVKTFYEGVN